MEVPESLGNHRNYLETTKNPVCSIPILTSLLQKRNHLNLVDFFRKSLLFYQWGIFMSKRDFGIKSHSKWDTLIHYKTIKLRIFILFICLYIYKNNLLILKSLIIYQIISDINENFLNGK